MTPCIFIVDSVELLELTATFLSSADIATPTLLFLCCLSKLYLQINCLPQENKVYIMKVSQVMPCGNIIPVRFDNCTTRTNAEPLMFNL